MEIIVRAAKHRDLDAMYRITSRAHLTDFYLDVISPDRRADFNMRYQQSLQAKQKFRTLFMKRLSSPVWYCYVACEDERIVGYTLACISDGQLELKGLFVDPVHQSKGVGSRLFEASLQTAQNGTPIRFKVLQKNLRAKRLYERYGFYVTSSSATTFFGASLDVMKRL